jgi:O-antigen/teichoic acid export membrane protein
VIITIIFGKEYESGTTALLILTVGQLFYVGTGIVDQIFLMSGGQKAWLRISTLIFVLTIMLDAILVPRLHVIGASLVSSTMMLLMGVLSVVMLRHRLQFWIFDRFHVKMVVAALVSGLIVHLFNFHVETLPGLMIASALTALLFGASVFMLGVEQNDRAVLRKIIKR